MSPAPTEITRLLRAWSEGDKQALDALIPLVYDDLHRVAHMHVAAERDGQTLQTTALINEAYVRLVASKKLALEDRKQFLAACSRIMRQILVDAARSRLTLKRGGNLTLVQLDEATTASALSVNIIALDDALNALSAFDARKAQVVDLRIFGGLSVEDTAGILRISADTVTRDMHLATAWLRRELGRGSPDGI